MKPPLFAVLIVAVLSLAACGSSSPATAARPSPSPSPRARNGAAGELVKITGMELILSSAAGDVTVDYTDTTSFQRASTGTLADVTVGKCVVVTGQKDATGALIAAAVRLSDKVAGACAGPGGPGGGPGGGFGGNRPPPSPGATPRFNGSAVAGEVVGATGTAIQVKDRTGTIQDLTIPTTVRVSKASAAAAADLRLHQCLQAQGPRAATGTVTARSITIVPPAATGCAAATGGFGRFGGGRGNGNASPGAPSGAAPPGD